MLCGKCGKKEATVHVQKFVNGKMEAYHLCQDCAEQLSGSEAMDGLNFAEILLSLAGKSITHAAHQHKMEPDVSADENKTLVCPECGWDLEKFQKTGYLGCPECYSAFAEVLQPLLAKMHRGTVHTGKIPALTDQDHDIHERFLLKQQIRELQKLLELHVQKEEYEEAARIRDEIQSVNERLGEHHDA